ELPGSDIKDVIDTLSDDELCDLAVEIANVFRRLEDLPNNGKFGVVWGDDADLVGSWPVEIAGMTQVMTRWGRKTGVMDTEFEQILEWVKANYETYFEQVRPITYFGDLSSKNVMVHEGRFAGL